MGNRTIKAPQFGGRLCLTARHAFTLLEVLVVVGVIALLVAILLPSLARSREQTRAVTCRTNLSTLGKALFLYTVDYGGMLPYEDREPEIAPGVPDPRTCWFDAVDHPYLGKAKASKQVKVCPTVQLDDPKAEESYRMNSKLAEATNKMDPAKLEFYRPYRSLRSLDRPAATVMLFDGDIGGETISFKGRWRLKGDKGDDVSYRHNMNTNLLFADWHAEGMHQNVLKAKSIRNSPVIWQPADMGPWDPKQ